MISPLSSRSFTSSSSGREETYEPISSAGVCSSAMDETGMAAADRNIAAASRPEIIRFVHLPFSMSSSFPVCFDLQFPIYALMALFFMSSWVCPPFRDDRIHPFCISQTKQAHRKAKKFKKNRPVDVCSLQLMLASIHLRPVLYPLINMCYVLFPFDPFPSVLQKRLTPKSLSLIPKAARSFLRDCPSV